MEDWKKKDLCTIVNDDIIGNLKNGIVPWEQQQNDPPRNLYTGETYRGINQIRLNALGYDQNYFLTFKQARAMGGNVRKGEHGHLIVHWKPKEEVNSFTGKKEQTSVLRSHRLFNISQCENINPELVPPPIERQVSPEKAAEDIYAKMPNRPKIFNSIDLRNYNLKDDCIQIPNRFDFPDAQSYYDALFKQMILSSGHPSRLDRKELKEMEFKSKSLDSESLTAEIGASYLKSHIGMKQSAKRVSPEYIQWMESMLKHDRKFIINSSTQAQKATDYILGVNREKARDVGKEQMPEMNKTMLREQELKEMREKTEEKEKSLSR